MHFYIDNITQRREIWPGHNVFFLLESDIYQEKHFMLIYAAGNAASSLQLPWNCQYKTVSITLVHGLGACRREPICV